MKDLVPMGPAQKLIQNREGNSFRPRRESSPLQSQQTQSRKNKGKNLAAPTVVSPKMHEEIIEHYHTWEKVLCISLILKLWILIQLEYDEMQYYYKHNPTILVMLVGW